MMEGPLGAESEEKREPVSDIDTALVDSLKVLDPDGRLEKPTSLTPAANFSRMPPSRSRSLRANRSNHFPR